MAKLHVVGLSTEDLALLTNELKDPYVFGIQLGLEPCDVERILQERGSAKKEQITGLLTRWSENVNASRSTLVKALKEMNHIALAKRLEETCGSQEAEGM